MEDDLLCFGLSKLQQFYFLFSYFCKSKKYEVAIPIYYFWFYIIFIVNSKRFEDDYWLFWPSYIYHNGT